MKNFLTRMLLAGVALAAGFGAAALAQQPPAQGDVPPGAQRPPHDGWRGKGKHGGMRGLGMRVLRQLDLTDAQREQVRAVARREAEGLKPQREELRQLLGQRREGATLTPEQEARVQTLRSEMRAAAERTHAEILNLLTPEQRAKYEQLKQEHEKRRREFRERRTRGQNPVI